MTAKRFKSEILIFHGNPYNHINPARAAKLAPSLKRPISVLVRRGRAVHGPGMEGREVGTR